MMKKPKFAHHCIEWDGLFISEFDPEWDACLCYSQKDGADLKELQIRFDNAMNHLHNFHCCNCDYRNDSWNL